LRKKEYLIIFILLSIFLQPYISTKFTEDISDKSSYSAADESGPFISGFYLVDGLSFTRDYSDSVYIDVVDEDGVDQVWCYYGINGTNDWTNISMQYSYGDTYSCSISGYLDAFETTWFFHFSANDTNGMKSTYTYSLIIEYIEGDGPLPIWTYLLPIIAVGSIIVVALVGIGWWYKKRR
jgi:hypothetical protein